MLDDAPTAFQFPVSRSVRAGIFVSTVCLAAALAVLAWSWPLWPTGYAWQRMLSLSAVLLWLLASMQACQQWRDAPCGRLLWRSRAWAWQDALGPPQTVSVRALDCVWDGQSVVVLRLQLAKTHKQRPRVHWLWLEQRMAPPLWGDLRRAMLHWRRRSQR